MDDRQQDGHVAVGVLSDTHGLLRPAVLKSLQGVDHIIHAGDIGSAQVLAALRAVAPVTAVRGNCDLEAWADALPPQAEVVLGGARILVGHVIQRMARPTAGIERREKDQNVAPGGDIAAVVFGHSHVASVEERENVLYLNPGSAGPRRFGRPRTIARLEIIPAGISESGAGPMAWPQVSATILTVGD